MVLYGHILSSGIGLVRVLDLFCVGLALSGYLAGFITDLATLGVRFITDN